MAREFEPLSPSGATAQWVPRTRQIVRNGTIFLGGGMKGGRFTWCGGGRRRGSPKLSRYRRRVLAVKPVLTLDAIFQARSSPVRTQALLRRLGKMRLARDQW